MLCAFEMQHRDRTYVVTGAASGIGAATARYLRERGAKVITSDLHDADVIADLATAEGRAALVSGVARASAGHLDAIIANAGGGPPATSLSLNFFGAVATLDGLLPLLSDSAAPRAVAVSSIAALNAANREVVEACLRMDESAANRLAWAAYTAGTLATAGESPIPEPVRAPIAAYASAKRALERWCRKAAVEPRWAGSGVLLNAVALGFFDTPAAAYLLASPETRSALGRLMPLASAYPGRPEQAAALLAFCASAENAQMTGQILHADAGFECRTKGDTT